MKIAAVLLIGGTLLAASLAAQPDSQSNPLYDAKLHEGLLPGQAGLPQPVAHPLAGDLSASIQLERARAQLRMGHADEAIVAARAAVALKPQKALLTEACYLLGALDLTLGTSDALMESETMLRKAVALADSARVRYALAVALLKRRKADEAVTEARQALRAGPTGDLAARARRLICQNRAVGAPATPPPTPSAATDIGRAQQDASLATGSSATQPKIAYRVNPTYPKELSKKQVEGTVVVELVIDEEGCVTAARVVRGEETGFGDAALAAVRQWIFEPATANGQPVKGRYTLATNFAVAKPPSSGSAENSGGASHAPG
ncbi:MAG TPA: TonB family protein [Thermoanaerobaculia bacterium]